MAIRFVLEMPRSEVANFLDTMERTRDAQALTVRESDVFQPDNPLIDVTVVAEDFDVVDALYDWAEHVPQRQSLYFNLYQGGRYRLNAYDVDSLKNAIADDLEDLDISPPPRPLVVSRAGNSIAEVPYGGPMTDGTALIPATTKVTFGAIDHIAFRVRDLARAERFYRTFFGMDVIYRARLQDDLWEQFDESFDWTESIHTGERPDLVRMNNGPVTLTLVDAGQARILHEQRLDHVSVTAPRETMANIRGQVLFHSYTVLEDTPVAFRFVDPFGLIWQIIADDTLNEEPADGAR